VSTVVVVFPFDLFGGAGTGAGAELLASELREVLADNRREKTPTRARAYTDHVKIDDFTFETIADYRDWRKQGRQAVRTALRRKDFLVWLSGNHLGALPVYDELSAQRDAVVVQLDAHLDIHRFTGYTTEPSHGNFLLHCAGPLPPITSVGHRELLLLPDQVAPHFREAVSAERFILEPESVLSGLRTFTASGRVFIDIDCDVFDPAFFPATTQPAPFGLSPQQVLRLLDTCWSERVAGLILSEFEPGRDENDRSLGTLVWLLEWVLLRRYGG